MERVIVVLLMLAVLPGCGSETTTTTQTLDGVVGLKCASISNDENAPCAMTEVAAGALTVVDGGIVHRNEPVFITTVVENLTPDAWIGYWSVGFDASCLGTLEPTLFVPVQPTPTVDPGTTWTVTSGSACADMPLGERIMQATIYDSDPATVIDVVEVHFTLVE